MTNVTVAFELTRSAGLKSAHIYINGELLPFQNDKAKARLPTGKAFEIYWRIQGNPSSTLGIKYTIAGATKTAATSKIASNRSRKSDFVFVQL